MARKTAKSTGSKSKNQHIDNKPSKKASIGTKIAFLIGSSVAFLAALAEFTGYSLKELVQAKESNSIESSVLHQPRVILLPVAGQLNLHNLGKSDLYLWGSKFGDTPPIIEKDPRVIPVGSFYYILTDKLRTNDTSGEKLIPFEVYLSDSLKDQYIAKFNLLIKVKGEDFVIHTQQMGVVQDEWGNL